MTTAQPNPRYTELMQTIDHALKNLLPRATPGGAHTMLVTFRFLTATLLEKGFINETEAEALLDRVHTAYRNHTSGDPAMTHDQIKTQTLADLHGVYELLRGSTAEAAALLVSMHLASLLVMRTAHYLDGFELAEEIIQLYYVVEAEHPGQWEALGGPPIPDERKA